MENNNLRLIEKRGYFALNGLLLVDRPTISWFFLNPPVTQDVLLKVG